MKPQVADCRRFSYLGIAHWNLISAHHADSILSTTKPGQRTTRAFSNRILTLYPEFAYLSNPVPNVSIFTGCEGSPVVREGDDRRCAMPKRGFGSTIDSSAARSFS